MKKTVITIAMTLAPALLAAQATATTTTSANASASVAPSSFSAEGRAKLDATFERARAARVPEQAMRHRVAEGQAKGASEAEIVASTAQLEARLESAQQAMVSAGRSHPSDADVERGAAAEEQGVTSAQISALASNTPPDHSLVDGLASLAAKVNANGAAAASAGLGVAAGASAVGNAAAGASAAGTGTHAVTGSVAGSVTGAVRAAVGKKP